MLYGSAMGADEDVEGAENDFAIDRDAVRVPRDKITREEVRAGAAREARDKRRTAAAREARDRKKRENPFKHPERPSSAEAKPRKAFPLLSAKVQPIWFLGSGPIQSEWASLAEGDALALELGALEEAGLYAAYLERVEASLNVYGQKLDERPGDLYKRLWRRPARKSTGDVGAKLQKSRARSHRRRFG